MIWIQNICEKAPVIASQMVTLFSETLEPLGGGIKLEEKVYLIPGSSPAVCSDSRETAHKELLCRMRYL